MLPCKQYLIKGVCHYGKRCQYLHREVKYCEEHQDFLNKAYKQNPECLKYLVNYKSEIKILNEMARKYEEKKDVESVLINSVIIGKRLTVFKNHEIS